MNLCFSEQLRIFSFEVLLNYEATMLIKQQTLSI